MITSVQVTPTSGVSSSFALAPKVTTGGYVRTLDGDLCDGRKLRYPIAILVRDDEGEVLVSEERFHMHAAAPTEQDALDAFRCTLVGYLETLEEIEDRLGAHLAEQLDYLRAIIV